MSPNLDEVREWLQIAWEDLITAKLILDHNQTLLRIACFHCQQSIEKSLKAFLT
ncbi:TPA: HEPN domain-containing protein [Candidatus Poribacteria bacterium]|nr:HEPN domain-containing protein [Candidatus Poribacteria bacterium]